MASSAVYIAIEDGFEFAEITCTTLVCCVIL